MTQLSDIRTLGFSAPFLGPWFSSSDPDRVLSLPAPQADLGVRLPDPGAAGPLIWQAPALGTLGYARSGPRAPLAILRLRAADGSRLFDTPGIFVARFAFHDGVASRLRQLWEALPPATDNAALNDRPFPASLTLAVPGADATAIGAMVVPPVAAGDTGEALGLDPIGPAFRPRLTRDFKGPMPVMPDLGAQVSVSPTDPVTAATLLRLNTQQIAQSTLYAHDADGLPIDPGMVAAQFLALVTVHPELMPEIIPGVATPSPPRPRDICATDNALSVHLMASSGGTLHPQAAARVSAQTSDSSTEAGAVLMSLTGQDATLRLAAPDTGDPDAEQMIAGLLPNGTHLAQPELAVLTTPLTRDQLRLGITAHEALLTGLAANTQSQEFPSSQIAVARGLVDLNITGAGFGAALTGCLATGPGNMASEVADPDFGSPTAEPDPADLPLDLVPDDLRAHLTLTLKHVTGTGARDGIDFVTGQALLASLRLDPAALPQGVAAPVPGTAVRAYLHTLDAKTGRLAYLPDGCGRWREAAGTLALDLVLTGLPPYTEAGDPPTVAFDILMTAPGRPRLLRDLRGPRPVFAPGTPLGDASSAPVVLHAEAGRTDPEPHLQSPGETLIADPDGTPRLILPDAAAGYSPDTLANVLDATHSVTRLPAPSMPAPVRDLAAMTGAAVTETDTFDIGGGLVGRHRGTYAATAVRALLATAPASSRLLGDSALAAPFQTVRGMPALQVSAAVRGPATAALAEALRGITTPDPIDLVQNAPEPLAIDDPDDPGAQIAVLRTTGPGGEGAQAGAALAALNTFDALRDIETALADLKSQAPAQLAPVITQIEAAIAGQAHRGRAIHRRLLAAQGTTETATALNAAVGQAEHEVVLAAETFSDAAGPAGDFRNALVAGMTANPTLRVIAMVPDRIAATRIFDPDTTMDDGAKQWLAPLIGEDPDRVVVLRSSGPLRSRLRGFGSYVAVDGLAAWVLPGGLSEWGLERNSSIALGLFGEAITRGRSQLVETTTRRLMAWFLGVDETALPFDWADLSARPTTGDGP
ncbi:hypothetical protein [uncultured Roseobacter sp.]|uniref:hypothetical protein n=1 Tax=uncultured Roseobacter sp. TaxID=114847 RepID=UPI0026063889|nr:hypothetical protein [uncultured Roseobacter sp.]